MERLERAIESIQGTIEQQGGNLIVKMKVTEQHSSLLFFCLTLISQPKAVSETDEHDLAQLMAKAGRENAEVSGDEDDEELIV
jgi:translation initiation factor 2 subunit 1